MKTECENRICYPVLGCFLLWFSATAAADSMNQEQYLKDSREAAGELARALKKTLKASMKEKGPMQSIQICNQKAPEITRKISMRQGLQVKRTALKYRNSENRPDSWESRVLKSFEARKQTGEEIEKLEYGEITRLQGKPVYRYMKAIPTGEVCLLCHGKVISPPLADRIRNLYPQDRATGFDKGDIRGAFSIVRELSVK